MSTSVDIPKTLGALIIGAFFASLYVYLVFGASLLIIGHFYASLAGGVSFQTLLYYKMYPTDATDIKTLVRVQNRVISSYVS